MSTDISEPVNLPNVEEVHGIYFNSKTEIAELQYRSSGVVYVIGFPLAEILKSEDWFIALRRSLTQAASERTDARPGKPTR